MLWIVLLAQAIGDKALETGIEAQSEGRAVTISIEGSEARVRIPKVLVVPIQIGKNSPLSKRRRKIEANRKNGGSLSLQVMLRR